MKPNPVIWFEIYVQDMDRAKAFYEKVLGTRLEPLPNPGGNADDLTMLAFPMEMTATGAGGALVKMHDVPSGPGGTMVYFSCDDCAVEAGRVAEAGGKVMREKMSIGQYGAIALAYDTEGNLFGMHSQA